MKLKMTEQKFVNVSASIDDVLKEEYDKSIVNIEKIDVCNFCETSEEETEIDEFTDTEKRIEKLKETLFPVSTDSNDENNYNSFINAISFAIRFNVEQKTALCSLAESKESIDSDLFV